MYKINTENIGGVKKYVWHYRKGEKEYGPFTYEDIIGMVREGEIGPDDYVLKFGNRKFVKVSEVQELFDIIKKSEEKNEEETEASEEQLEEKIKEHSEEKKEEVKEEYHVAYENRMPHVQKKRKNESTGITIAVIIAGAAVLCLAAWLLLKMF